MLRRLLTPERSPAVEETIGSRGLPLIVLRFSTRLDTQSSPSTKRFIGFGQTRFPFSSLLEASAIGERSRRRRPARSASTFFSFLREISKRVEFPRPSLPGSATLPMRLKVALSDVLYRIQDRAFPTIGPRLS